MKKILIKVSGNVSRDEKFLDFINKKSKEGRIVIVCGAGTQINNSLKAKGFGIEYDKRGRVIKSVEEACIVKKTLEQEKEKLKKRLNNNEIHIEAPLIKVNSIECHVNADKLVETYYLGFDEIYIFTLNDRVKDKENMFKDYPKVKVIGA